MRRARVCGVAATLLLLAASGPARAEEPGAEGHGPRPELEHGSDTPADHGGGPRLLDNWFSLSFGEGKEHQNGPFGFAILNFAVLVAIFVKFGRRPLADYLQQRHVSIRKDMEEASALNREARQKLQEIEGKLASLDSDIAAIKQSVAEDAEREKQHIIKTAEAEAERIVKQADETLVREIRRAHRRLEAEAVDAAMKAAERLIRQRLTPEDRRRLDQEYLAQISSGGGLQ